MDPDVVLAWDWLNDQLRHTLNPLYYTPMGAFIRNVPWAHQTFQVLQMLGTSLLLVAIGVLDLRLIGFPRIGQPSALRRMTQVARGAAVLTLVSGIFLVCGSPDRYLFNAEARWKFVFVLIAGLNILLFDTPVARRHDGAGGREPSLLRRMLAAAALGACLGAMAIGRIAGTAGT